jgi:hypothetical protein
MPRHSVHAAAIAASQQPYRDEPLVRLGSPPVQPLKQPPITSFRARQDSFSPSEESSLPPGLSFQTFRRHFILAAIASLLLMVAFAFLPQFYPPVSLVFRNLLAGILAFLAADALKTHFLSLGWSLPETVFRQWSIAALPAALWAIVKELVRLVVVFVCLPEFRNHPASSAYWLGLGFAIGESGLRNLNFVAHTRLYKSILEAAASDLEGDFSALDHFAPDSAAAEHGQERLTDHESVADFLGPALADEPELLQQAIHEAWVADERRLEIEEALGHPLYELPAILLLLWTLNTCASLRCTTCR